ncbi:MAG: ATP-binding cassette domain-containing protein [Gammaproteobacteria bacterium]|nr:ATP-binding cassette domain-containing protein [Gammaproteobacteria bacterium]
MLNFKELSLRRGPRELLHDVNGTIHQGQKVGITGANGTGKSSLFALIRNELQADTGEFSLPPKTVIAHVAQETPAVEHTAIDYVMNGDTEMRALEKEIAQAEQQNEGERLANLYMQMESIDGYRAKTRASVLMHGLGFTTEQETNPVKSFSGGWRMRLNLAQALMCRSDLLLLDEPTNHLDLEAVIWLEDWLRSYQGTLLLISHDRDFLDKITTHIAHIEQAELTFYTGNYTAFEKRRAEKLANQQSAYEKQQREIAHMQDFVRRFKAKASKARQAQSRVKALERMELIAQAHVDSPFDFEFKQPDKMPDMLIKLDKIGAGYNDTRLLDNVELLIHAGDRIGLLGHNGAGKSTLIKLLAGELGLQAGERSDAKDLKIGYFAQHQLEQLDSHASPLLHLQRLDPRATEQSLRNFLGGFAFNGDFAASPVAPMSGGEKARLVLAILVYQKPNLLLLDEPTNHLDLEMRHALSVALQDYVGAMVIVSHDRHLLRTVTDTLLLVDSGKVSPFEGDLEDYRQWVKDSLKQETDTDSSQSNGAGNKKQQRQDAAEKRKLLQPLRNKLKTLDKKIEKLNSEKTSIENQLADNSIYDDSNKQQLKTLLEQQVNVTQSLEETEEEWLLISEEMEALQQDS